MKKDAVAATAVVAAVEDAGALLVNAEEDPLAIHKNRILVEILPTSFSNLPMRLGWKLSKKKLNHTS